MGSEKRRSTATDSNDEGSARAWTSGSSSHTDQRIGVGPGGEPNARALQRDPARDEATSTLGVEQDVRKGRDFRPCSEVALLDVVGRAQHLAVQWIGLSALAPRGDVVAVHLR